MKQPRVLIPILLAAGLMLGVWFADRHGAARQNFTVSNSDGSVVMRGILKKRWFKTGKVDWLFSDGEEMWVGAEAWIETRGGRFPLPRNVAGQISNPDTIRHISGNWNGDELRVSLRGGQCAGWTQVDLSFAHGKLRAAEALRYEKDESFPIYP